APTSLTVRSPSWTGALFPVGMITYSPAISLRIKSFSRFISFVPPGPEKNSSGRFMTVLTVIFSFLHCNMQNRDLRRIVKSWQRLLIASQTAGNKKLYLVLLVQSMDIIRKPSLISPIKTSQERHHNLAAMVMGADHQIHIPHLAGISKDKTVRPVRHHNLHTV